MKELSALQNAVFRTGAILMIAGLATHLFGGVWSMTVFAVGVLMFGSMQLMASYEGHNFVVRRLRSQQTIGTGFLLAAAVIMSMQDLNWGWFHHNEWVVCLAIGAMLQLYTALRIPQELKKENKQS